MKIHRSKPMSHAALCSFIVASGIAIAGGVPVDTETDKLLPSDGQAFMNFGRAIDIRDGIIAIGADNDNINGNPNSSAYLFKASTGTERFILDPGPGNAGKGFGRSIAVGGGYVAVGADIGPGSGKVFVFDVTTGHLVREITPNNGSTWDRFGYSVAIDNGVLAVGAIWDGPTDNGAVYLFDLETGNQTAKIIEPWPRFGYSVALDEGVLAVGATFPAPNSNGRVFLIDIDTRDVLHVLDPGVPGLHVNFGHAVSMDSGIVAVGAISSDDMGAESGAAYLIDISTGDQLHKLVPNNGQAGDGFGTSISIDGDIVAVGSPLHQTSGSGRQGAVYQFNVQSGDPLSEYHASDADASDRLGASVAIEGSIVCAGAWGDDDLGSGSGAAYIFEAICTVDLNSDGSVNFFDLSIFLSNFTDQQADADINNDGSWNFFDVSLFLNAFNAGCP